VQTLSGQYQNEKQALRIWRKLKKCLKNKYFFDIESDLINLKKGELSWGW
jgi:hypothetical protein